ncbi:MAG TPA: acireductone synthase [Leptolyngbyaceae cyanobacterium]
MTQQISDQVQAVLLDIEGTTTPVDFVFGVLFPFAHDQAESFLRTNGATSAVQADLALLRQEYEADLAQGLAVPDWQGGDPVAAVPYIHYLIKCDRKSTGLKSLQGKIWDQGYLEGTLQSQIYPDVQPAFLRWKAAGKQLFIFSSGSIQAQKLLFANTKHGDLTPLLSGYFDTTTGPKKEAESYQKIAANIGLPTEQILFISDVAAELKAASSAGMKTLFSYRPGNHSNDAEGFILIENFDSV